MPPDGVKKASAAVLPGHAACNARAFVPLDLSSCGTREGPDPLQRRPAVDDA